MLNMQIDKIIFKSNRCIHSKIFKKLKTFFEQRHSSKKIYLSFFTSFEKFSISINFQKYTILQKRLSSKTIKIQSFRFTIEDYDEKNEFFSKIMLNSNFRYVIEKIDKEYFFVKFFKKKRRIKIIRKFQQFTFVKFFIRKSNLIQKLIRRFNRRFKITIFVNEKCEFDLNFDTFLNVFFIDAIAFQFLIEFKKKKKTFSLMMKKLNKIIDNVKENLIQTKFDFDMN
jgi:hypothetical protein